MEEDITFKKAMKIAEDIIDRFKKIEGKPWGVDGTMIELSKQVGELSKLIMVYEGYYFSNRDKDDLQYTSNKEKIGGELADILFAVIRLAKYYNIDLLKSHLKAREDEDNLLKSKGV